MDTDSVGHQAVLLHEAVDGLNIQPNGIYVDGTFGRGGHSALILSKLGANGRLLAIDKDPEAIAAAKERFGGDERFSIVQNSFAEIAEILEEQGLSGKVDGILLDLGVSSPQLDQAKRGFSFMKEGPLDMRMNPDEGESAADWLAHASVEEMTEVLKKSGEERFGKRIAHAIDEKRKIEPIRTTQQLVAVITDAQPVKDKHKHPATRSFQGIRIFINRELVDLEKFLDKAVAQLTPRGRLSVISFHSLEDRMVKRKFQRLAHGEVLPRGLPIRDCEIGKEVKNIAKKVRADAKEVSENPRARSAVLRIVEKLVKD
ncbi:MAG: 16S rRNA (cytosine(1402)-N(4))-methyltransferase RsmH [Pseudomonadales bacterium]|nr:16S rRNA (cytosine(1402)-N(4))-methyltransferase RsmH [Pseudomonadales bacterium]